MMVLKETEDGFEPIKGNPTLTSKDGKVRAPLKTLLHHSWSDSDREKFGVFLVEPVKIPEGKMIKGKPFFKKVGKKVTQEAEFKDSNPPPIVPVSDPLGELWVYVKELEARIKILESGK